MLGWHHIRMSLIYNPIAWHYFESSIDNRKNHFSSIVDSDHCVDMGALNVLFWSIVDYVLIILPINLKWSEFYGNPTLWLCFEYIFLLCLDDYIFRLHSNVSTAPTIYCIILVVGHGYFGYFGGSCLFEFPNFFHWSTTWDLKKVLRLHNSREFVR